jgi:hypothetical protein
MTIGTPFSVRDMPEFGFKQEIVAYTIGRMTYGLALGRQSSTPIPPQPMTAFLCRPEAVTNRLESFFYDRSTMSGRFASRRGYRHPALMPVLSDKTNFVHMAKNAMASYGAWPPISTRCRPTA